MTLAGRTALSDEMRMKFFTWQSCAASVMFQVPSTLFLAPSRQFASTIETCLKAAQW